MRESQFHIQQPQRSEVVNESEHTVHSGRKTRSFREHNPFKDKRQNYSSKKYFWEKASLWVSKNILLGRPWIIPLKIWSFQLIRFKFILYSYISEDLFYLLIIPTEM